MTACEKSEIMRRRRQTSSSTHYSRRFQLATILRIQNIQRTETTHRNHLARPQEWSHWDTSRHRVSGLSLRPACSSQQDSTDYSAPLYSMMIPRPCRERVNIAFVQLQDWSAWYDRFCNSSSDVLHLLRIFRSRREI